MVFDPLPPASGLYFLWLPYRKNGWEWMTTMSSTYSSWLSSAMRIYSYWVILSALFEQICKLVYFHTTSLSCVLCSVSLRVTSPIGKCLLLLLRQRLVGVENPKDLNGKQWWQNTLEWKCCFSWTSTGFKLRGDVPDPTYPHPSWKSLPYNFLCHCSHLRSYSQEGWWEGCLRDRAREGLRLGPSLKERSISVYSLVIWLGHQRESLVVNSTSWDCKT